MKKSIIILFAVLTTISLTAFGYISWGDTEEVDITYSVDSRFMATISKEDLHNATSVLDIVPKIATGWWEVSFQTVTVALLQEDGEVLAIGKEKTLNAEQTKLLQSTDYSNHFYIKARGNDIHPETGQIEDYVYYITVVPEKEAEYAAGKEALIDHLKIKSKKAIAVMEEDKLQPGRVNFTISKNGIITNVKLDSTSGYPTVDETMLELISNTSGKWNPAANSMGEKVDQDLVFFFGIQGC